MKLCIEAHVVELVKYYEENLSGLKIEREQKDVYYTESLSRFVNNRQTFSFYINKQNNVFYYFIME